MGNKDEFSFIKHFIVYYKSIPIGFCQYYDYSKSKETRQGSTPIEGSFSIDYLIGEEAYLKKNLAPEIILLLTKEILKQKGAKRIIVSPNENNSPSKNALKKAGFLFDKDNKILLRLYNCVFKLH